MSKSLRCLSSVLIISFGIVVSPSWVSASGRKFPSYHQVAVELPTAGGGMLMYSRMWVLNRFLEAGFSTGGGVIETEFDLDNPSGGEVTGHTKSLILPYFGPRITAMYRVIGISVGYGFFYADTDFDVDWPGEGKLKGTKKGWGTGFYSPLLEISFLDPKRGVVYGVGLGGFYGTSFSDLSATNGHTTVVTNQNPLNTLTFHMSLAFGPRSWKDSKDVDW